MDTAQIHRVPAIRGKSNAHVDERTGQRNQQILPVCGVRAAGLDAHANAADVDLPHGLTKLRHQQQMTAFVQQTGEQQLGKERRSVRKSGERGN